MHWALMGQHLIYEIMVALDTGRERMAYKKEREIADTVIYSYHIF